MFICSFLINIYIIAIILLLIYNLSVIIKFLLQKCNVFPPYFLIGQNSGTKNEGSHVCYACAINTHFDDGVSVMASVGRWSRKFCCVNGIKRWKWVFCVYKMYDACCVLTSCFWNSIQVIQKLKTTEIKVEDFVWCFGVKCKTAVFKFSIYRMETVSKSFYFNFISFKTQIHGGWL